MAQVFISYVREDESAVERIERALAYAGVDVWRDVRDISLGRDWREAVREQIESGSLVFAACFSSTSVAASDSGQREELDLAISLHGSASKARRWLIPVRLDDCEVPPLALGGGRDLRDLQHVDLFGDAWDHGIARLVEEVQALLLPDVNPAEAWWWLPEQSITLGAARGRRWPEGLPTSALQTLGGHPGGVRSLHAVSTAAGMRVAVSGFEVVRLWDPASGQPTGEWVAAPLDVVTAMCTLPVGDRVLVATASGGHPLRLWDPTTGSAWGDPFRPPAASAGHRRLCTLPTPDGRVLLASGGADGDARIWLWDPVTGQPAMDPLVGHEGQVTCLCAVPIGDRVLLASGGEDRTVRMWDPVTGGPYALGSWRDGVVADEGVYDLCAVPIEGGTVLAIALDKGKVDRRDAAEGWRLGEPLWGHQGPVLAVGAMPVGQRVLLVSAGHGMSVRLWDPASGAAIGRPLMAHSGWITALGVVPVGGRLLLASGALDGSVQLWSAPDRPRDAAEEAARPGRPQRRKLLPLHEAAVLHGHGDAVRTVCAVPLEDGRAVLASSGRDRTLRFWDPTIGRAHGEGMTAHEGFVSALCAFQANGRSFLASADRVVAGKDAVPTIRFWDPVAAIPVGHPIVTDEVDQLCAVPVGGRTLLAAADPRGTVRLWDPVTGKAHGGPLTGPGPIVGMCTIPTPAGPAMLAAASRDDGIRLWDPDSGQPVGPRFRAGRIRPFFPTGAWGLWPLPTAGGSKLATVHGDATIELWVWDTTTGRPVARHVLQDAEHLYFLQPLPDGAGGVLLAGGGPDNDVRFWRPDNGTQVGEPLVGHTDVVLALCAVPGDVTMLATAGYDSTLRLWSPGQPDGQPVAGPRHPVPASGTSFEERCRSELDDDGGRAHLRGDIVAWLAAFGHHKAFDTPRWEGMGATIAALHELWSTRPGELIDRLATLTLPVGGWAIYGAHRLVDEISHPPASARYDQLLSAALGVADDLGIGLVPWEIHHKVRLTAQARRGEAQETGETTRSRTEQRD